MRDVLLLAVKGILGGSGLAAFVFTAAQLATRRRAHILELYRQAFPMLDEPEMREARNYVTKVMGADAYKCEHRLDIDAHRSVPDYAVWKEHKKQPEIVGRVFDQLGLLMREGRLPLNILARFYASPALRCWCRLRDYIDATRDSRPQPGHFWEWENLIFEIIIPSLESDRGIWEGVSKHDVLEHLREEAKHGRETLHRDTSYSPSGQTWELGPWYKVWMW